jgi:REP element-mobilizing transposase RayT
LRHDNFIPDARVIEAHSRGRLPHWQVDNAAYFITFRLRDSLPRAVARELFLERQRMIRDCATATERARLDAAFAHRLDRELDAGKGSCLLTSHAQTIAESLRHFDRVRYELHAWCVMPNHVHVLIYVSRGADIPGILHSWKSFTAHRMNEGVVWQREYFDRVIRSPQEFSDTRAYIRSNPAKAGLKDWPWVG